MKTILVSGVSALALMAMAPIAMAQDDGRGAAGGAGGNMPSAQSEGGGSAPDGGNAAGAGSYLAEKGDGGSRAGDAGPGAGGKMPSSEKSADNERSGRDKADSPRAEGPAAGREGGGDPENFEKSAEGKSDKGDKKGAEPKSAISVAASVRTSFAARSWSQIGPPPNVQSSRSASPISKARTSPSPSTIGASTSAS